jgi:hypothetical protein
MCANSQQVEGKKVTEEIEECRDAWEYDANESKALTESDSEIEKRNLDTDSLRASQARDTQARACLRTFLLPLIIRSFA